MKTLRARLHLSTLLFAALIPPHALAQDTPPSAPVAPAKVESFEGAYAPLQPLADAPGPLASDALMEGSFYVPSTGETVRWGSLPNRLSTPVLTVPSGSLVTIDAISHEGILEDQGRDPAGFFGRYGVPQENVLQDAIRLTSSDIQHNFAGQGPHVVTGPVAIEGAEKGDVLMIETLRIEPRVPYGVISNRHGKGALPGEYPLGEKPDPAASAERPELYRNVSIFTPLREFRGSWFGVLHDRSARQVMFELQPFMGIMGVAVDTEEEVNSIPPAIYGGNIDVNELGAGSTLYLPIQVAGGLFYAGDPHASQGDGEVALTALELSARATFRLTVLKAGDPRLPTDSAMTAPFGETADYWIPIGLDPDLDEAMKSAVRQSIAFLTERLDMDPATALAYLSAATSYEVSQVVDRTKGVHALIAKKDFPAAAEMAPVE